MKQSDHILRSRSAFTLVELLVVIAIIGVLVTILLPAVQAARESARKKQCMNHVRQMAVAFLHHESAQHFFPTGGWGHGWIGEPDVGYDAYQPGSWAYNILTYLEEQELRELGSGYSILDPARDEFLRKVVGTPVAVFNCPSRRGSGPSRYRGSALAKNLSSCGSNNGCLVVRGDYRANTGNHAHFAGAGPGIHTDLFGNLEKSQWKQAYSEWISWVRADLRHNGICYEISMVRVRDITDGTAHTAMLGEKQMNSDCYYGGCGAADDDQCLYSGFDRDNNGITAEGFEIYWPKLDDPRIDKSDYRFGSAHPAGFHMAFCDGSVRTLDYEIDGKVFRLMGGRSDD